MSWLRRLFDRAEAPRQDPWQVRIDALDPAGLPQFIDDVRGEPAAVRHDLLQRARLALGDAPILLRALARAAPEEAAPLWRRLTAHPAFALEAHDALADLVDDVEQARAHRERAAALAPRDAAHLQRCLGDRPTRIPPRLAQGRWPPLVDRLPARFLARGPIGRGPHGQVIRVVAAAPWAAKGLASALADHPALDAVFSTLEAASALDLPGLATIEHLSRADGCWVRTLGERTLMEQPTADLSAVRDAVAALHAAGIAHGRITPGNIIIDAAGRARLTDPGLCRLGGVEPDPAADRAALARLEGTA